ncbi:MAG: hypothetical protein ACRET7_11230 [Burkholderiales bacterium]
MRIALPRGDLDIETSPIYFEQALLVACLRAARRQAQRFKGGAAVIKHPVAFTHQSPLPPGEGRGEGSHPYFSGTGLFWLYGTLVRLPVRARTQTVSSAILRQHVAQQPVAAP